MINKNVNGFRRYKGILLCCDCYRIPEIQDDIKGVWTRLLRNDAIQGRWCCALCQVVLFDPVTLIRSRLFERDHMDVFSKVATVWELVTSGAPFEDVLAENQKCRSGHLCRARHRSVGTDVPRRSFARYPEACTVPDKHTRQDVTQLETRTSLRGPSW